MSLPLVGSVWRIREVYPGSRSLIFTHPGSQISDPKQQQKTGVKKFFFVKPFFVATNFIKLNIILFLICRRKKFGPIFQKLLKFLPQKLSPSPQKYGFGIRDPEKTYSGSRIQGSKKHQIQDPGSGSATLGRVSICWGSSGVSLVSPSARV
jgi:hypothetical protein